MLLVKDRTVSAGAQETQARSLGWEDSLKQEMATCSCILAWKIPWIQERSLASCSLWDHKESDMTERSAALRLSVCFLDNFFFLVDHFKVFIEFAAIWVLFCVLIFGP